MIFNSERAYCGKDVDIGGPLDHLGVCSIYNKENKMKTPKGRIAFSEQRWEMIYDAISSYVHFMIAMGEWNERDPLVSDYHGILKIIERRVDRGVKENKISFKVF